MGQLAKTGVRRRWLARAAAAALLVTSLGAVAFAVGPREETSAGRTPLPRIVIEKGDKCVEDTAYMRRNHMKLLKHQRDETVHKGIRTEKYSLQNCIDCHASSKNNSVLGSDENFCQSCHAYAAVKLDCWDCHASKPKQAVQVPAATAATSSATFAQAKP